MSTGKAKEYDAFIMEHETTQTPLALTAGRHIVGMVLVAFIAAKIFVPAMLQGAGFAILASAFAMALISAAVICGLLALFFTGFAKRLGKAGMARIFFALAWLVLVLGLAGIMLAIKLPASAPEDTARRAPPAAAQTATPAPPQSPAAPAAPTITKTKDGWVTQDGQLYTGWHRVGDVQCYFENGQSDHCLEPVKSQTVAPAQPSAPTIFQTPDGWWVTQDGHLYSGDGISDGKECHFENGKRIYCLVPVD